MKLLYTIILIFTLLRVGGTNNLKTITHKHLIMQQHQPQPAGQHLGKLLLLILCVGFMIIPSMERDEPPADTTSSTNTRGYLKTDTTTNTATISEGKDISAK